MISADTLSDRRADMTLENLDRMVKLYGKPESPAEGTAEVRPLTRYGDEYRGLRSIADFSSKKHPYVDYLPLGMGFTLFSGPNDCGKSSVAQKLASEVLLGTTKGIWHGEPHGVLFILSEEDPGIVKNAMKALGVSDMLMRQLLFTYVSSESGRRKDSDYDTVRLPEDTEWLRRTCAEHDIRLVVFDALADCMESARLSDRGDVSRIIKPLNKWAQEANVLIIGIHHNNKGNEGNAKAAVSGSTAFTDKARVLVSFDVDEESGRRVMQLVKCKGRSDNPAYEYKFCSRVVQTDDGESENVGVIQSFDPTDLTIDQLRRDRGQPASQASEDRRRTTEEVLDWLTDYLDEGPAPFSEIRKAAQQQEGFSQSQLRNAKDRSDGRIATKKDESNHQRGAASLWYLAD